MKKSYCYNGKTYVFADVHMEAGMLYGRCITHPNYDSWAWLDPHGFQFEQEHRVEALETPYHEHSLSIPHGCHYWGGEIRNNTLWHQQW